MLESWRHLNPRGELRAQVRGHHRGRAGVPGRRQRRRQPPAPLGRLRGHRRRQARGPEARRGSGGRGAAHRARHAGRGGRARPRRDQRGRGSAERRAGPEARPARRRPHRLRHQRAHVHRLLDAPPVPPGGAAARRHHGHPPPRVHAGRRHPGPRARGPLHRAEPEHHDLPAARGRGDPAAPGARWESAAWATWWVGATCSRSEPGLTGKAALLDVSPPRERAAAAGAGAALRSPGAQIHTPAAPGCARRRPRSAPSPASVAEVVRSASTTRTAAWAWRRPGRSRAASATPGCPRAGSSCATRARPGTSTPPTASRAWSSTCRAWWPTPPGARPTGARS